MIKEIILHGFGKFYQEKIVFQPGINLIYGANGSGKSTILDAIYAVFYGFAKPGLKKGVLSDLFYKYKPKHSINYAVTLELVYRGEDYRIERKFLESGDELNVFNLTSSTDMTPDIENCAVHRILQPGRFFFGLSDYEFSVLNYLKQQRQEEALDTVYDDIKMKENEEIKLLERIKNYISSQIKEIGTKRAQSTYLGLLYKQREEQLNRLAKVPTINDQVLLDLENKFNKKQNELQEVEEEIRHWENIKKSKTKSGPSWGSVILFIVIGVVIDVFLAQTRGYTSPSFIGFSIIFILTTVFMIRSVVKNIKPVAEDAQVMENLSQLWKMKTDISLEKKDLQRLYASHKDTLESVSTADDELNQLEEKISDVEKKLSVLHKSEEYVQRLMAEKMSAYKPQIEDDIAKFSYGIMKDDSIALSLTDQGHLQVHSDGAKTMDLENMSFGEKEQLSMAYRMTLSQLIAGHEPWLWDEPFVFFDDERIENAYLNIVDIAKVRQIFLTSSHSRDEYVIRRLQLSEVNFIDLANQ